MNKLSTFTTRVLDISTTELFSKAVLESVEWLRKGEIISIPTETVYGLAADGLNTLALEKVFATKGRPSTNPLILHVSSLKMLKMCVKRVPEVVYQLSESFWPGPLTLVLEKSELIPDIVTANSNTVAIRWPGHPFFREIIATLGSPIAAPSANISNRLSSTVADHVLRYFDGKIPLVVDGGHCAVGIESTVVDLTSARPKLLRPGIISPSDLSGILPTLFSEKVGFSKLLDKSKAHPSSMESVDTVLKSPGQLPLHYAPLKPLSVLAFYDEDQLVQFATTRNLSCSDCFLLSHENLSLTQNWGAFVLIPDDPEAYARALFHLLHQADSDANDTKHIIVNLPPDSPKWLGIRDRLNKATHR